LFNYLDLIDPGFEPQISRTRNKYVKRFCHSTGVNWEIFGCKIIHFHRKL